MSSYLLKTFRRRVVKSIKETAAVEQPPGILIYIKVPRDEAVAVAAFINAKLRGAKAGGRKSRGHRWTDRAALSTDPRAVKMRELRARRKAEKEALEQT